MMEQRKYLMVGLPLSGKSSFLGPFWHVVESEEITASYSIVIQPDDREYLNRLRDSWLSCQVVERTPFGTIKEVTLSLLDRSTGISHILTIPDLAGETFRLLFEQRELQPQYADLFTEADGIMLFISASVKST
jgi:hypothetical protein